MTLIPLEKDIFPINTISIVITNLLLDAEKFLKKQTSFNPAMRYFFFFFNMQRVSQLQYLINYITSTLKGLAISTKFFSFRRKPNSSITHT